MHDKLKHLSDVQVNDLVQRYYEKEKVSELIQEFDIDTLPSKLVSLLPPTEHDDLFCPYCDEQNLVTKMVSRDSWSSPDPSCPICKHKISNNCRCKNCLREKEDEKQYELDQKTIIVFNTYYREYEECSNIENLTLSDAVYLLSVSRHSMSENLEYIDPFCSDQPELAPTFDFQNSIIQHLYGKGFIYICPESDVNAFVFDDALEQTEAYYPTKVDWMLLPSKSAEDKKKYLQELELTVKGDQWPPHWKSDISKIWEQITKEECIEYLLHSAAKRNLPIDKVGDKTHSIFENVLQEYSPAQVFNLIFQSAMSTNDYVVRNNIPQYRAKNMFIGNIQRKADKAKAEGWTIKNSRRDFNCPQTIVSITFFDTFLEIGEKSFETAISKYLKVGSE